MRLLAYAAIALTILVALAAATFRVVPEALPDAEAPASPSARQVVVDGVPVCVFRHAGQIVAGVGRCGVEVPVPPPAVGPPDPPVERALPPGHPPIDRDGSGLGEGGPLIAV